ncbi:MAG: hypothetical protein ABJO02_01960, partial [Reichenbachiella sp.]
MNRFLKVLSLAILTTACNSNKKTNTDKNTLGELQHGFPVSVEAQADFEEGLLLLHSFEYDDARKAFSIAAEEDPNEMMAYWGMAMSHYKALWGLQNVVDGRNILEMTGATKEERIAKTEEGIERDFWIGLELLFGEGELKERNQAFADHLSQLHKANPEQQEIAAFYALSLLWSA